MDELCYTSNMDSAKIIYKMLSAFEKQLDNEQFDIDLLDAKAWKISELRMYRYLEMLEKAGYIEGVTVKPSPSTGYYITLSDPKITLKGIEYLAENSAIQKVVQALRTTKDIIK